MTMRSLLDGYFKDGVTIKKEIGFFIAIMFWSVATMVAALLTIPAHVLTFFWESGRDGFIDTFHSRYLYARPSIFMKACKAAESANGALRLHPQLIQACERLTGDDSPCYTCYNNPEGCDSCGVEFARIVLAKAMKK